MSNAEVVIGQANSWPLIAEIITITIVWDILLAQSLHKLANT